MDDTVIQSFNTVVNFDEDFPSGCDNILFAEASISLMDHSSETKQSSNISSIVNERVDYVINPSSTSSPGCRSRLYSKSCQSIPQQFSYSVDLIKKKKSQVDDALQPTHSNDNTIHVTEASIRQGQTDESFSDLIVENNVPFNLTTTPLSMDHTGNEFRVLNGQTHKRALPRIFSLDWSRRPHSMFDHEAELQILREQLAGRTIEAETMSRRLMCMEDEERIIKNRLNALARNGSLKADTVISLKNTVASLYADVESLRCAHMQSLDHQADLKEEINSLKCSRDWYNEQLHLARESRDRLQSETERIHLLLRQGEELNHRLVHENACLQVQLACSQAALVEAKRSMSHQLEGIRVDMIEREAVFENLSSEQVSLEVTNTERENVLYQLRTDLSVVQASMKVAEEQLELKHSKLIQLEGLLKETEARCQDLQNNLCTSEGQRKFAETRLKEYMEERQTLLDKIEALQNSFLRSDAACEQMFEEKTSLISALKSAQREKSTLDSHLVKLKDDLSRFELSFTKLRFELENKSDIIKQLVEERHNLMMKTELLQVSLCNSQHAINTLNMESSDVQKALDVKLNGECYCIGKGETSVPTLVDCMVQTLDFQSLASSQQSTSPTESECPVFVNGGFLTHCSIPLVDVQHIPTSVVSATTISSPYYFENVAGDAYGNHSLSKESHKRATPPHDSCRTELMETEAGSTEISNFSHLQQPEEFSPTRINVSMLQKEVDALKFIDHSQNRSVSNHFTDMQAQSPFIDSGYFSPEGQISVLNEDIREHAVDHAADDSSLQFSETHCETMVFCRTQGKQTRMNHPELQERSPSIFKQPSPGSVKSVKADDTEIIIVELTRKNAELQAKMAAWEASDRAIDTRKQMNLELERTRQELVEAQCKVRELREKCQKIAQETATSRELSLNSHIDEMEALRAIIKATTKHLKVISNEMKQVQKEKTAYQTELARLRGGMRAHLERFRLFIGTEARASGGSMMSIDLSVVEKLLGDSAKLPITCSKPLDGLNKCFENLQLEINQLEDDVVHHVMAVHDLAPQYWAC